MRKILAVFLAVGIAAVFASCGPDNSNVTTTLGLNTSATSATTTEVQPLTYILTTSPDKTAPSQPTTRFEISDVVSVPDVSVDVNVSINGSDVSKPSVNFSVAPSVATTIPTASYVSTSATTTTKTTTKTTTTTKPTTTTQAVDKKPVNIVINSEAVNSDSERIILEIDNSYWTGDIKANSQNIQVKVDGITLEDTVPLKVTSAKNADGNQEIIIDLKDKGVGSGSTVSFTIPEGFLQTSSGAQYNNSYSASANY